MKVRSVLRLLTRAHEQNWRFSVLVGSLYVAFLIWMHAHHEMWRDEIHIWTVARQAGGFVGIVTGDRVYDGHPPLWYWYLYAWTFITQSPWGIQAATVLAASVATFVFLRFAPFPRFLKILVLCSYFIGYEYSVMARDYVLGWLLVCLFCACYEPKRRRLIACGVLLGLLALSSAYGLLMAGALALFLVLDNVNLSRSAGFPKLWSLTMQPQLLVSALFAVAGMFFCLATTEPPDPNPFSPDWHPESLTVDALPAMSTRVVVGFLPLFRPGLHFWSSEMMLWQNPAWTLYVGIGLMLAAILSLLPAWRALLAYLVFAVAMSVFQQIRHTGYPRHWGHYFLFLVAVTWLAKATNPKRNFVLSTVLFMVSLAVSVPSYLSAVVGDTRWVFSGGKQTAEFIRKNGLQGLPLIAGPDWFVLTVAGYLERPFTRVETDEFHETVVFHSRRRGFSTGALLDRAAAVSRQTHGPVLVVSNQLLPRAPSNATMRWLFTSEPSIIPDEVFSVYQLRAN
jgi:hypothetical protein